jgi:hypothetical protein
VGEASGPGFTVTDDACGGDHERAEALAKFLQAVAQLEEAAPDSKYVPHWLLAPPHARVRTCRFVATLGRIHVVVCGVGVGADGWWPFV